MKKLLVALLLLALAATAAAAAETAAPRSAPELQLRAAYLFNFVRFVTWPEASRPAGDAPIVIGVSGDDAFVPVLAQVIGSQRLEGHPLTVRTVHTNEEAGACHAIFVGRTAGFARMVEALRGKPVLVVADDDEHPVPGVVIALFAQENKLRFAIDVDAAHQAGLTISSKLLQLAVVRGASRPGGSR